MAETTISDVRNTLSEPGCWTLTAVTDSTNRKQHLRAFICSDAVAGAAGGQKVQLLSPTHKKLIEASHE